MRRANLVIDNPCSQEWDKMTREAGGRHCSACDELIVDYTNSSAEEIEQAHKDSNGDSPISWASWHLRPGSILALLAYGEHRIHPLHVKRMQSDHGFGGASGMQMNLLGNLHL